MTRPAPAPEAPAARPSAAARRRWTLPIVLLFFLAERLLVEGLTSGAEKG